MTTTATTSSAALVVDSISYTYRKEFTRVPVHALKNLSLEVARGECLGFLGPNGAGKTTAIKCILGLVRPSAGRILINGIPSTDVRSRQHVGYVPEQPYFYDNLRVRELMEVYATLAGVPRGKRRASVAHALQRVGLIGRDHFAMRSLSKGLMQRVAMAQAIVAKPQLLILDEPFSGLDPIGRQEFRDLFFTLKQEGVTLLLCSHVLADIEFLCERAAILARGELKGIVDLASARREGARHFEVVIEGDDGPPSFDDVITKIAKGVTRQVQGKTAVYTFEQGADARALAAHILATASSGGRYHLEAFRPASLNLTEIFKELVAEGRPASGENTLAAK